MNKYAENGYDMRQLRLVTKSVWLLALLTGLLYLRVFVVDLFPALSSGDGGSTRPLTAILLLVALLGLLSTWYWELAGGVTAVVAGLALGVAVWATGPETSWLNAFFYSSPFVISGGLSLFCWRRGQIN